MKGYVYVLGNKSLPGIYKIGGTTKSPEIRAKELSNTSVPTPYDVLLSVEVDDWRKSEAFIHKSLDDNRVTDNREFFQCSMEDIEFQFDKLNLTNKPLEYVIYSHKGGSGSTTVALAFADFYKGKGFKVSVVEYCDNQYPHDCTERYGFKSFQERYGYDDPDPQVKIHISPSFHGNKSIELLNRAVAQEARVIIPTYIAPTDFEVLYQDILDCKKAKIKPYVLFSKVPYFSLSAEKMAQATITCNSLGAVVLPYSIPHSERFNEEFCNESTLTSPYSLFNVIIEGISLFFDYEDYERNEEANDELITLKEKALKNAEVKVAYDELDDEFQLISAQLTTKEN